MTVSLLKSLWNCHHLSSVARTAIASMCVSEGFNNDHFFRHESGHFAPPPSLFIRSRLNICLGNIIFNWKFWNNMCYTLNCSDIIEMTYNWVKVNFKKSIYNTCTLLSGLDSHYQKCRKEKIIFFWLVLNPPRNSLVLAHITSRPNTRS